MFTLALLRSSLLLAGAGLMLAGNIALADGLDAPRLPALAQAQTVQPTPKAAPPRPQLDQRAVGRACPQGQHWDAQSGRCATGAAATPMPLPQPQAATPIPIPAPQ